MGEPNGTIVHGRDPTECEANTYHAGLINRTRRRLGPTILAKMCGTKCLFPELLQYSLAPPFPPDAMLDDSSASLCLRTTLHEGGGEGRIWPKERLFPCEKLIDGRGSAFRKLVPHNFGQDCR